MEIQCQFHFSRWSTPYETENIYTCRVKTAEIKRPNHTIKKFVGCHEKGRNDKDIKAVSINFTGLKYFPRSLNEHYTNLTHLQVSNCQLSRISKQNLKGLEGLMTLCIVQCKLKYLPDDLLEGMPKLREVDFRNNEIEYASSKLLRPLIRRKHLVVVLLGNKNIDAQLAPGAEEGSLKTIQELMDLIDVQCKKPTQQVGTSATGNFKDFDRKIAELWTSGRFSDLTIVVGTKQFKVHKNILGMQNPTFAKIFEDHSEATVIKIAEFSIGAFEALLHFIYTGEVLNEENAKEKFVIADKFQVAEMRAVFELILFDQLSYLNALDIFLLAHSASSEFLKENAFAVISDTFPESLPDTFMENPEKVKRLFEQ